MQRKESMSTQAQKSTNRPNYTVFNSFHCPLRLLYDTFIDVLQCKLCTDMVYIQ